MPKLAAFPKAWIDDLCVTGRMPLREWITIASTLGVDGLEFYSGFLDLRTSDAPNTYRRMCDDLGLSIPMLCCSPDFTHPDAGFREEQVDAERRWIDLAADLGATYCRVLSGQRRPDVTRADGLRFAADGIRACLPHAAARGVTLVLENHYKDGYWEHPEFAQNTDVFLDLVAHVGEHPNFGINFDPSNTLLAGEDPLDLLRQIKDRVVTMHASDRYLTKGTLEDLRREENTSGYAARLQHGEIGKGLNDYDAIFQELKNVGFNGWISIEDGMDGADQLRRSVLFLRDKIARRWPPTE